MVKMSIVKIVFSVNALISLSICAAQIYILIQAHSHLNVIFNFFKLNYVLLLKKKKKRFYSLPTNAECLAWKC